MSLYTIAGTIGRISIVEDSLLPAIKQAVASFDLNRSFLPPSDYVDQQEASRGAT